MTLSRRVLVYLLIAFPIVWAIALVVSTYSARHEVDELFDTEMLVLARRTEAMLSRLRERDDHDEGRDRGEPDHDDRERRDEREPKAHHDRGDGHGEHDSDLVIMVWNSSGRAFIDTGGRGIPMRVGGNGFADLDIDGKRWRVLYRPATRTGYRVSVAQPVKEREELVRTVLISQQLPWLVALPLLFLAMGFAVRRALAPLRALAQALSTRGAADLTPLPVADVPPDLKAPVESMNALFGRIETSFARERRFTADAAHELRTPLAAVRAQWDAMRGARDDAERQRAQQRVTAGLSRLDRLVTQMLALSRLEAADVLSARQAIDWHPIIEQVVGDVLPIVEERAIELGCDWPAAGAAPFPLTGDAGLLAVLLRNLLENAVRHAPEGSAVDIRFETDSLRIENGGPALAPATLARLGERFFRVDASGTGSGLGISIAMRVAALHCLELRYGSLASGQGVVAELVRAPARA
ncbi:MAG: histidine kinase dimerization/phospho-acceptor domain-containing protein [Burkholderiaceae bacterium]